jgi:hypothetical protein
MRNIANVFIEAVREHEKYNPFCPYANRSHHWLYMSFGCSVCGDWSKYKHIQSENPCTLNDFNNCPLLREHTLSIKE